MIGTFESILEEIIRTGISKNSEFIDIGHQAMIGDMYEGLTSEVLRAGLLEGTNTRVCKGKIRVETSTGREYSHQIDCMVVIGEGERIPHTDHYIYDINNVLAIVEVKKTLTRSELKKSIDKFYNIFEMRMKPGVAFSDSHTAMAVRVQRDAFRAVFRKPYPGDGPSALSEFHTDPERAMYSAIRLSATMPVMIVWGYDGHRTEDGFREAILQIFKECNIYKGIGGPDCIFSGDFSYVKSTGMPFTREAPHRGDFLYAYTQRGLRSRTILNFLWYKICKRFDRDFMILSDGRTHSVNPLLSYTFTNHRKLGSRFYRIANRHLETRELEPPVPAVLSLEEWAAATLLFDGPIDLNDQEGLLTRLRRQCDDLTDLCRISNFQTPSRIDWSTFEQLIDGVSRSKLIASDRGKLFLATSRCVILFTKEGVIAFDNRDGAFNMLLPDGLLQYLRNGKLSHKSTAMLALFRDPKVGGVVSSDRSATPE